MSEPDPAPVIDLIEAFRRSKVMFAAVALGVFDCLETGPADAATLAARLRAEPEPLSRLADACVGLGFLRRQEDRYANEPVASEYLSRTSERTLAGYILYSNDVLYRLWTYLEDAVLQGGNRWEQAFGEKGAIFDHFFKTGEAMRAFLQGMHGFGLLSSPKVVSAFDLSPFHRLIDVGGGTGHLAIAACRRYPGLRAVVFDLPRVIEAVREDAGRWEELDSRMELFPGDFFTDDLPEGDIFALSQILHDWPDETAHLLLDKIYRRLPPGGAVLVVEKLLAEDKTGPLPALLQSVNMLLCTEGRERTLSEYRVLLESAGFWGIEGRVTGRPFDAVLARKRGNIPSIKLPAV